MRCAVFEAAERVLSPNFLFCPSKTAQLSAALLFKGL